MMPPHNERRTEGGAHVLDQGTLKRLTDAADRTEIYQALVRYCCGVDRSSEAMVNSAFHAGALDDHGGGPRPATELAHGIATHAHRPQLHITTNVLIELDGDSANVESYFFLSPISADDGPVVPFRQGRYLDRFERRDGAWKIVNRRVVDPSGGRWVPSQPAPATPPAR